MAHVLAGEERAAVRKMFRETYPFFADHEAKTDREIPVVARRRA